MREGTQMIGPHGILDSTMDRVIGRLQGRDDGAGLVEYALLVALIAIALIVALVFLRQGLGNSFSTAATTLNSIP